MGDKAFSAGNPFAGISADTRPESRQECACCQGKGWAQWFVVSEYLVRECILTGDDFRHAILTCGHLLCSCTAGTRCYDGWFNARDARSKALWTEAKATGRRDTKAAERIKHQLAVEFPHEPRFYCDVFKVNRPPTYAERMADRDRKIAILNEEHGRQS